MTESKMTYARAAAQQARLDAFERELEALCEKHGVHLEPEDSHGACHVRFDGPAHPMAPRADLALSQPYEGGWAKLFDAQTRLRKYVTGRTKGGRKRVVVRHPERLARAMRLLAYWGRDL